MPHKFHQDGAAYSITELQDSFIPLNKMPETFDPVGQSIVVPKEFFAIKDLPNNNRAQIKGCATSHPRRARPPPCTSKRACPRFMPRNMLARACLRFMAYVLSKDVDKSNKALYKLMFGDKAHIAYYMDQNANLHKNKKHLYLKNDNVLIETSGLTPKPCAVSHAPSTHVPLTLRAPNLPSIRPSLNRASCSHAAQSNDKAAPAATAKAAPAVEAEAPKAAPAASKVEAEVPKAAPAASKGKAAASKVCALFDTRPLDSPTHVPSTRPSIDSRALDSRALDPSSPKSTLDSPVLESRFLLPRRTEQRQGGAGGHGEGGAGGRG